MIFKVYKSEIDKILLGYISLCQNNICKESVYPALQKVNLITPGWDLKNTSIVPQPNGSFFVHYRPKASINPANGLPRYVSPVRKFWIARIDWDAPQFKEKTYPFITYSAITAMPYRYGRIGPGI
jgi:hypothetical protein